MSEKFYYLLLSLIIHLSATIGFASSTLMSVFTDLEPDDLVAISGLIASLRSDPSRQTKLLFVVGEGDAYMKKVRIEKLIQQYKLPKHVKAQVLVTSSTADQNGFDGVDCLSSEEFNAAKETSQAFSESDREKMISNSMKELEKEITFHSGEIVLFILKPLRRELSTLSKLALAPEKYLKSVKVFFYEGRFNMRNSIAASTEKFTIDFERFKMLRNLLASGTQPPFIVSNSDLKQDGYPTVIKDYLLSDILFEKSIPLKDQERSLAAFNVCSKQIMESLTTSSSPVTGSIQRSVTLWNLKMMAEFHSKLKRSFLRDRSDRSDSDYTKSFDSLMRDLQSLIQQPNLRFQLDEDQKEKREHLKESTTKFEKYLTTEKKAQLAQDGLEWSLYSAILKYSDVQFTLADYQPIMGFFHPEFFQTKLQVETLGPLGLLEKYKGSNPKKEEQLTLTVNRAKRIKVPFCDYLNPLKNALKGPFENP